MKIPTPKDSLQYIKSNKVFVTLVLIGLLIAYSMYYKQPQPLSKSVNTMYFASGSADSMNMMAAPETSGIGGIAGRITTTNSYISAQVADVESAVNDITAKAESLGGYAVNKHINTPEFGKSGYVTVRVANNGLDTFLQTVRDMSVKIVSENIETQDITQEYIDVNARLTQLEDTKAKLVAIGDKANTVNDLITVQNQLTNIQTQIDSLKGHITYLNTNANTTLITINLSTDELGLPYAPKYAWRPGVVIKQTVRSILTAAQNVASGILVLLVWAAFLVPLFILVKAILFALNRTKSKFKKA